MAAQEADTSTPETDTPSTKILRRSTPSMKTRDRDSEATHSQPIRRDLLKTRDRTMPKKRELVLPLVRADSITKYLVEL